MNLSKPEEGTNLVANWDGEPVEFGNFISSFINVTHIFSIYTFSF